ncbi:methyl-accepting chemotaxis protein [Clostridium hydrogenum]|uniref:methyl-accepting chemotaxis protein n=1 Tax=Clostridium hydrogenum TaxID=2855764 RepID=UPI001F1FAE81|nr:methyl-accepting chemotaxis protein [Clostridium hydrogenum]
MGNNATLVVKYQKKVLKIVVLLYSVSAIAAFAFISFFRVIGVYSNKELKWTNIFIFGAVIAIEVCILAFMYKQTSKPEKWQRYFRTLNLLLILICYVNYMFLNMLTSSREIWLIVFYFIILSALFLDTKMVWLSVILSVVCNVILIKIDQFFIPDKAFLLRESILRIIVIFFISLGILLFTYLASDILKKVDAEEKAINEKSEKVSGLFDKISQFAQVILNASDSLAAAIEEENSGIQEIASNSKYISNGANEILEKSTKNIEVLNELLDINKGVSSEVAMLADNSSNLINTSNINKEYLKKLLDTMDIIYKNSMHNYGSIEKLEEKSNKIYGIISNIDEIADQTNLLALNASIEAARAGEYGKGFSVVANEVRELAENTRNSLETATSIINEFKNEIYEVKEAISKDNEKVFSGKEITDNTVKHTIEIIEGLKEIDGNIKDINNFTTKLLNKTNNVVEFNAEVGNLVKNTVDKFDTITEAVNQVAATSEEIIASSEELKATAAEMNEVKQ